MNRLRCLKIRDLLICRKVNLHLFELFHRAIIYSNRFTGWHRWLSFTIKAASLSCGTCGLVKINNRNIERQQAVYGTSSLFGGDAAATRLLSLFTVQQEEDKCSAVTCDGAWQKRYEATQTLHPTGRQTDFKSCVNITTVLSACLT